MPTRPSPPVHTTRCSPGRAFRRPCAPLTCWALCIATLGLLSAACSRLTLVRDGYPEAVIVVSQEPDTDETLAATELQDYLEKMTGKKVREGLLHRGGLRARILQGGTVRPGDSMEPRS